MGLAHHVLLVKWSHACNYRGKRIGIWSSAPAGKGQLAQRALSGSMHRVSHGLHLPAPPGMYSRPENSRVPSTLN